MLWFLLYRGWWSMNTSTIEWKFLRNNDIISRKWKSKIYQAQMLRFTGYWFWPQRQLMIFQISLVARGKNIKWRYSPKILILCDWYWYILVINGLSHMKTHLFVARPFWQLANICLADYFFSLFRSFVLVDHWLSWNSVSLKTSLRNDERNSRLILRSLKWKFASLFCGELARKITSRISMAGLVSNAIDRSTLMQDGWRQYSSAVT